jgi:ribosomal subunit interface protein
MTLRVSGKNLDIGDALRGHVQGRVDDIVPRYVDGGFSGHVTIQRDGTAFRTDCFIHLTTGLTLQSESVAHDPHASVDLAVERLARRLKRHKQRIKEFHGASDGPEGPEEATAYVIEAPDLDEEALPDGFTPVIIAESSARMKPLSVSQAVIELDLTGAPVVVFRHAGHGRVNVVYRRPDGHIGWIDLNAVAADAA